MAYEDYPYYYTKNEPDFDWKFMLVILLIWVMLIICSLL